MFYKFNAVLTHSNFNLIEFSFSTSLLFLVKTLKIKSSLNTKQVCPFYSQCVNLYYLSFSFYAAFFKNSSPINNYIHNKKI